MRVFLALLLTLSAFGQGVSVMFPGPGMNSGPPPPPAITLISHASCAGAPSAGCTTSAINSTGASSCLAHVSTSVSGASVMCRVLDSKLNTWTPLPQQTNASPGLGERLYYSINPTVGTGHTFTTDGNGGSTCDQPSLQVACFNNVIKILPVDQSVGSTQSAATTIKPGALTPANPFSLLVTGLGTNFVGSTTITGVDSGFTVTDTVQATVNNFGGSLAYLVQGGAAASDPQWSITGMNEALGSTQAILINGTTAPPASPALVDHTVFIGTAGSTGGVAASGANCAVVNIVGFGATGTVTDSNLNSYTCLTAQNNSNFEQKLCYNVGGTFTNAMTFTLAGGAAGGMQVAVFSGAGGGFDTSTGGTPTGLGVQGGSVTAAVGGSLFVTGFVYANTSTPSLLGVDGGFKITDVIPAAGGQVGGALAYYVQTPTTAQNPKWWITLSELSGITNAVFKP